jgi:hypothetical protein
MDPPGLAFEHFDGIGRYRETDLGLPIDTTGEIGGVHFDGPRELAQVLRNDPRVVACTTRQLYRQALAHVETEDEQWLIDKLSTRFTESGHRYRELVRALVTSEAFRYSGGNR